MLTPQLVDKHIAGHRLVRPEEEDREQRPLLQAANIKGVAIDVSLDRPQKAVIDHPRSPTHPSTALLDCTPGTASQ